MRSSIALQHAIVALLSSNASAFTSHYSSIARHHSSRALSSDEAERRFTVRNSVAKDTTATSTSTATTAATTTGGGAEAKRAEVVLVGCGAPNRGMGWYHAIQMLEGRCPSASLDYVVEPWFLGDDGAAGPGGSEFAEWSNDVASEYGTVFTAELSTLPMPPERPRLALISGRTADNPALLTQCIAAGCKTIYLEKPGAPTVKELQRMQTEAREAGVEVLMGYNKVKRGCVSDDFPSRFRHDIYM